MVRFFIVFHLQTEAPALQYGARRSGSESPVTAHLKMYFPQALAWFDEIGSNIAAEFLERWPSLEKLQRARPATIERFFNPAFVRYRQARARRKSRPVVIPCLAFARSWA